MAKRLIIDMNRCIGCYNCQIACKDEHVDNDWAPIARPQPDTGHFWYRIEERVRGQVPKVKVSYMHHVCHHCDSAPCMEDCGKDAIYKREDGAVIIDPARCDGCGDCLKACPYGAIYFNKGLNIAQKCTWCAHLLDTGWTTPRCVDVCPTDALIFAEEEELAEKLEHSETLLTEKGCDPRVHYIGLPKNFIAGAVYDPEEDECLEGAVVTLFDALKNPVRTTVSDRFGDFWFEDLAVGNYGLVVEKNGYQPQRLDNISNEDDINVGDIALTCIAAA